MVRLQHQNRHVLSEREDKIRHSVPGTIVPGGVQGFSAHAQFEECRYAHITGRKEPNKPHKRSTRYLVTVVSNLSKHLHVAVIFLKRTTCRRTGVYLILFKERLPFIARFIEINSRILLLQVVAKTREHTAYHFHFQEIPTI